MQIDFQQLCNKEWELNVKNTFESNFKENEIYNNVNKQFFLFSKDKNLSFSQIEKDDNNNFPKLLPNEINFILNLISKEILEKYFYFCSGFFIENILIGCYLFLGQDAMDKEIKPIFNKEQIEKMQMGLDKNGKGYCLFINFCTIYEPTEQELEELKKSTEDLLNLLK